MVARNWHQVMRILEQFPRLKKIQASHGNVELSHYASYYQNDLIPVYDMDYFRDKGYSLDNNLIGNDIYNQFFHGSGAIIISNAYSKTTMNEYNKWCEMFLEIAKKTDVNIRHPKQAKKFMINDVIIRLARDDPVLCMKLINNEYFTKFCDILLGCFKFGALTTHWIEPNGDRQLSHVGMLYNVM